jgi:diaminopimelate epimerase
MGVPILEAGRIPVAAPGISPAERVINVPLDRLATGGGPTGWQGLDRWQETCGLDARVTCVSMGNPHAVLYCRDVAAVPLSAVGPWLETQAAFPHRINVHFVQVHSPREATMRTWERGSGITLACGTGACAVCVAGALAGRTERALLAHLPGGDLELHWRENDDQVAMTGPAVEVFSGEWDA